MKNLLLFFFLCVFSFNASSQVVTGVYKGKMEVDSPKYTVDFELTLKEKNGKLYGYCHRLFIVNDILYYNLVKVNARIADSVLIVEDEKSVSNNFKENTSGVKTVMFFTIQKENDTVSVMPGEWSTSRTKRYLPITGKIAVKREENYLSTQLYKKLEDNRLATEMAFEEKTKPVVKPTVTLPSAEPTQPAITKANNQTKQQPNNPAVAANQPKQNLPTAPVVNKPVVDSSTLIAATNNELKQQTNNPSVAANQPKQNLPAAPIVNKPAVDSSTLIAATNNELKQQTNNPSVAVNQPKQNLPAAPIVNKPAVDSSTLIAATNNESKQQTNNPTVAANQPKQNLPTAPVVNQPAVDSSTLIAATNNKIKQQTNNPSVAANQPKQNLPSAPIVNQPAVDSATLIAATNNKVKQQANNPTVAVNQPKQNQSTNPVGNKPTAVKGKDSVQAVAINQNKQQLKPGTSSNPVEKPKPQPVLSAPQKQQPVSNQVVTQTPPVQQPSTAVVTEKKTANLTKIGEQHEDSDSINKPLASTKQPVINNPVIVKRSLEIIQMVDITEDSVVLSLYDNGEIDGDTVSVFLNNELLISKAGLSAKAFKKTIYFKAGETIQLTLFAENLGAIPPNTGLLVITTEKERYQVFFSSSLNKSSSVLLRRKE